MTTYMTRVIMCDIEGCPVIFMAEGTVVDLRDEAVKEGWSWNTGPDEDQDLCPTHSKAAKVPVDGGLGPMSNEEMERILTRGRDTGQLDSEWHQT